MIPRLGSVCLGLLCCSLVLFTSLWYFSFVWLWYFFVIRLILLCDTIVIVIYTSYFSVYLTQCFTFCFMLFNYHIPNYFAMEQGSDNVTLVTFSWQRVYNFLAFLCTWILQVCCRHSNSVRDVLLWAQAYFRSVEKIKKIKHEGLG